MFGAVDLKPVFYIVDTLHDIIVGVMKGQASFVHVHQVLQVNLYQALPLLADPRLKKEMFSTMDIPFVTTTGIIPTHECSVECSDILAELLQNIQNMDECRLTSLWIMFGVGDMKPIFDLAATLHMKIVDPAKERASFVQVQVQLHLCQALPFVADHRTKKEMFSTMDLPFVMTTGVILTHKCSVECSDILVERLQRDLDMDKCRQTSLWMMFSVMVMNPVFYLVPTLHEKIVDRVKEQESFVQVHQVPALDLTLIGLVALASAG